MTGRAAAGAFTLAACAGSLDLVALTGLGGAFASVVTGNLVTTGSAVATADLRQLAASVTAAAGYGAGVAAWSLAWRNHPAAVRLPLAAELACLAAIALAWLACGGRPAAVPGSVMLFAGAAAMGGQSVVALRIGAATTYLTGAFTQGLLTPARAGARGAALRQIGGLLAGALAAALVMLAARPLAALVPCLLLAAALCLLPASAG